MRKLNLLVGVLAVIFFTIPFINTGSYVYANDLVSQDAIKTKNVVDNEVKKINNMTEDEKIVELNRLLEQYDGLSTTLDNPVISGRNVKPQQPSTEAKVVNGGLNFYAYNKAGINKLANLFANLSFSEGAAGGSAGLSATIAGALGVATAATLGFAAVLGAMGAYAAVQFNSARSIMRDHEKAGHSKAGVRVSVTEVIDITNKGINAYA